MVSQHTSSGETVDQNALIRGGMVGGLLLILFGLLALAAPFVVGLSLSILLGALLVVGALTHVAAAIWAGNLVGIAWQLLLGLVYGVAGIVVLANPLVGLTTLTLLMAAFFAASGVVQIAWAVTGDRHRRWLGVSGVVALVFAIMLVAQFPVSALWAVGVLFGVNLLLTGSSMVINSRERRATAGVETPGEAGGQQM